MLYRLSKAFWFLAQPSSLLGLAIVSGLVLAAGQRTRRVGLRLASAGALLALIGGLSPLANLLLRPLEQRFPIVTVPAGSRDYAGIIVLGGGEDARVSEARGQLHTNEAGERITEAALLGLRLPAAKIVFSGAAALFMVKDVPAGGAVGAFWREMGIDRQRILLESQSRNTFENAVFTRDLLKPKPGERWLLVTSAAHMPRSVGAFRRVGFEVVPYPVDFRTQSSATLTEILELGSVPAGLKRLDDAIKEWVGLLSYWLLGRTNALFPGPN